MKIIGLTSHYTGNHDNSAALLIDGKIIFAESQERISRIKHDRHFPIKSIKHALTFGKLKLSDIDYFASGSPPANSFNLLLSYIKGFKYTNLKKILQWVMARIFLLFKSSELKSDSQTPNMYSELGLPEEKLLFVSHYIAHAETAYCFSGMDECLVVTWDGYGLDKDGEPLCGSIFYGKNGRLMLLEKIPVYTSLALYYGAVTVALGFKLNDGEGKTMGLAAYGTQSPALDRIRDLFPYFDGEKWVARNNWLEINGVSRLEYFRLSPTYQYLRWLIEEFDAEQVAFAAQKVLEEEGEKYIKYLIKKYKQKNVAVAGGIFLNVKFNMRLLKNKVVDNLFVYPNPGDGGVAVGAAIVAAKLLGQKISIANLDSVNLGCGFTDREIRQTIKSFRKKVNVVKLGSNFYETIAKKIAAGKVIGWFQGRGEWGPRALGHRSVLADPRDISVKERINSKLKERDWFMPFAPVILDEHKNRVLTHNFGTPFMTLVDDVKKDIVKKIPAVIHIDNTTRSQIIKREINPKYWKVVHEFYKLTGVPMLLNTSFNRHGLPIVHSPKDAIEHLLWGCIDELVINNYLITSK